MNKERKLLLYSWYQVMNDVAVIVMADSYWGCKLCDAEHALMYENFIHTDWCLVSRTKNYYEGK